MTFIIALGVIIILLCSASVFKLMQPKQDASANRKKRGTNASRNHAKAYTPKHKPTKTKPATVAKTKTVHKPQPEHIEPVLKSTPIKAESDKRVDTTQPAVEIKPVPKLISLNLFAATDKPYAGYELLQSLLSCGMRFGAMNIFHRHEKKTGVGPILFSLASCTKDGTFDLAKIGGFSCNGLVLFMKPHEVTEPVKVFELMLESADQLINDLGGKVLNEKQQLLKKEDVVTLYQQLKQFEKDRKTMDLFD